MNDIILNSLDAPAREYALSHGLHVEDSIENICNFLQEIFRLDGRLPSITQIYNSKAEINSSNEARAAEIYWRVRNLVSLSPLSDLKKEIAMQLLLNISKGNFASMMPNKTPKTFAEAVALVTEVKEKYYKRNEGNRVNMVNGIQVNGNT